MKLLKELTIVVSNKPGQLTAALKRIARAGININALKTSAGYDLNMVRLVTDNPSRCRRMLEKAGYAVTDATVIGIPLPNQHGCLVKVTAALAKARININYLYASTTTVRGDALVVMHLSDALKAQKLLRKALRV